MSTPWLELLQSDPEFLAQEQERNPPPAAPFTIRSWGNVRTVPLPPRETFLGDAFALSTIQTIMGQGGVGKSRVSINIARNNVLGLDFCGLSTGTRPYRWLFIGNENSLHRLKRDVTAMSEGLTTEQIELLDRFIHLHSLETLDDSFICLSEDSIKARWYETVKAVNPDIIVPDPWGEVQFGDPNNDLDSRQSVRELLRICIRVNPKMAQLILHHGRTGRANIAQAAGWDKGNFGKGSRALYSGCRAVVNLAPANPDDHSRLVMVCAKSNDCPPFETRGIKLDETTLTYDTDPDFDFDAWQADVEGKRQPGNAKLSIQDVVDALAEGETDHKGLLERLKNEHDAAHRTANKWVKKALETGYLRKRKNGTYILTQKGTPRHSVQHAHD